MRIAAVSKMDKKEQHIDTTSMSMVTAGLWQGHERVIFKRNFQGSNVSTQALANEITMLRYLHGAFKLQGGDTVSPVMGLVSSTTATNEYGQAKLELVQERGEIDVFNFAVKLAKEERFVFTQRLMTRVLTIVRALHDCRVAHNDIKPENMVIRNLQQPAESVAFIDFGFACIVDPNLATHVHGDHGSWLDGHDFGTGCYRHPGLLARTPTNMFMSDLFACGMVCFTMFSNTSPYKSYEESFDFALPIHQTFVDGSWKRVLPMPDHVANHPRVRDWCDFVDELTSGKHTCVTDELLSHRFLIE